MTTKSTTVLLLIFIFVFSCQEALAQSGRHPDNRDTPARSCPPPEQRDQRDKQRCDQRRKPGSKGEAESPNPYKPKNNSRERVVTIVDPSTVVFGSLFFPGKYILCYLLQL